MIPMTTVHAFWKNIITAILIPPFLLLTRQGERPVTHHQLRQLHCCTRSLLRTTNQYISTFRNTTINRNTRIRISINITSPFLALHLYWNRQGPRIRIRWSRLVSREPSIVLHSTAFACNFNPCICMHSVVWLLFRRLSWDLTTGTENGG